MNLAWSDLRLPAIPLALAIILGMGGCAGRATRSEKQARGDLDAIERIYRPGGERPALPKLTADSPLSDYLLFAMLNEPRVEASFYEWSASVRRITVERSRPDPRLTVQADVFDPFQGGLAGAFQREITERVMTLMPGLMVDIPGPGKLKAAADVASAESRARYFAFESSVLQTAFAFKGAFYRLHFLDARLGVVQESLRLVDELERLARVRNEVGAVGLQDVLRSRIERERLSTEIANLEDSREPLLAQFRAALGLKAGDATPPVPRDLETTPSSVEPETVLTTAWSRNPQLKAMEAEVRLAEASLRLATKARVPDFSAGLEADLKASPLMVRPSLGVSLPLWRDKIAAQIAEAQAGKRAAEARLSAEQIALAVDFAEKSFMYREAGRNLHLLTDKLLPLAAQSLEVAQAGYVGGRVNFLDVIDAERTLLDFRLAEVESRIQRELALAELSLLIAGVSPARAPFLPPASAISPKDGQR